LPAAGILFALVVACGGGDGDEAASNDRSAPDAPAASSSQPVTGGGTTSEVLDLKTARQRLLDLRSFRFDMSMKMDLGELTKPSVDGEEDGLGAAFAALLLGAFNDMKAEGSFVAPDQADMKVSLGSLNVSFVQVGNKAWSRFAGGDWQETDPSSELGFGSSPTDMFEEFLPEEVLKGARTTRETMNGQQTTHYSFDKKSLEALAEKLDEETESLSELDSANMDIWVNDDNIPVKMLMDFAGKDEDGHKVSMQLSMNIRDINADIKIKPPV
jgi:hypothetical protein